MRLSIKTGIHTHSTYTHQSSWEGDPKMGNQTGLSVGILTFVTGRPSSSAFGHFPAGSSHKSRANNAESGLVWLFTRVSGPRIPSSPGTCDGDRDRDLAGPSRATIALQLAPFQQFPHSSLITQRFCIWRLSAAGPRPSTTVLWPISVHCSPDHGSQLAPNG